MRPRTKWLMALAVVAAATVPAPVRAATTSLSCTNAYMLCLNEATQVGSPQQELASLECGAEYTGCLRKKLLGI